MQQKCCDVRNDHAAQVEQVKTKCAPAALDGFSDEKVKIHGNRKEKDISVRRDKDVSQKPPDLPLQNGVSVKAQRVVKKITGIDLHEQIYHSHADGNDQHQIWDALVAVLVAEPLEISA